MHANDGERMTGGKLLIVDDEKVAMKNLEQVMKKEGYAVTATQSGGNALALLEKQPFDVVLTELRMEKVDGMQILKRCRESHPDTEVILITGYATLESAVEAMKQGAFYYLAKPCRLDEVRKVVAEALEKIRLQAREPQPARTGGKLSGQGAHPHPGLPTCSTCSTWRARSRPPTATS